MATLSKDTIKAHVRLFLDEQATNEAVFLTDDGEEFDDVGLDSIIEGKAEEALRYIYSVADESLVPWEWHNTPVYPVTATLFRILPTLSGISDSTQFEGYVTDVCFVTGTHEFVGAHYNSDNLTWEYYRNWPEKINSPFSNPGAPYKYYCTWDQKYYAYFDGLLTEMTVAIVEDEDFVTGYTPVSVTLSTSNVWRWNYATLKSWKALIPIDDAIPVNTAEFVMLHDKYATGTYERPKIAVNYGQDFVQLMLFSLKDRTNLDEFSISCVAKPAYSNNNLTVGDKLVDAFYYYLAGLVCQVLGDARQQGFFQEAAELSGVIVKSE